MSLLSTIIEHKKAETAARKARYPIPFLEAQAHYALPRRSFRQHLLSSSGVIAEFKRKSPSKGIIHEHADVKKVTTGYRDAGVAGISILTDETFFGGSSEDLKMARNGTPCPLLRKDFVLDPYQIIEARAIGADAILLIASVLEAPHLRTLTKLAQDLGMEVLVEIHDPSELEKLPEAADMVGVNNRNLRSGIVDVQHARQLVTQLPKSTLKVAESGITTPEDVLLLRNAGYQGFLIGTVFMEQASPEAACAKFMTKIGGIT